MAVTCICSQYLSLYPACGDWQVSCGRIPLRAVAACHSSAPTSARHPVVPVVHPVVPVVHSYRARRAANSFAPHHYASDGTDSATNSTLGADQLISAATRLGTASRLSRRIVQAFLTARRQPRKMIGAGDSRRRLSDRTSCDEKKQCLPRMSHQAFPLAVSSVLSRQQRTIARADISPRTSNMRRSTTPAASLRGVAW